MQGVTELTAAWETLRLPMIHSAVVREEIIMDI